MPLNGKANPVAKPSWLNDNAPAQIATVPAPKPSWVRKTPDVKKEESPSSERDSPAKVVLSRVTAKKDSESPKKDVTVKLQSREVKVPLKVEKIIPTQPILKKAQPKVEIKQTLVPEQKTLGLRENKTPSKSPTPLKSTPSTTPSKSPSKTPDYDDSDEDSSTEDETESDSDDDSDEITDSDDGEPFNNEKSEYPKPPSPGSLRKHLIIPPLKKVTPSPDKTESSERSQSPDHTFKKPELRKVITRQKSEVKERSASPEPKFFKTKLRKVPSSLRQKAFPREKLPVVELKKAPPKADSDISSRKMSEQFPHKPSILLNTESSKRIPPPPPPPPPPHGLKPPPEFEKRGITPKKREIIEKLKSRPRKRPDWSDMMKEVESARTRKLRHVQCNDRSSPIITCKSMTKVQGQYIFETEKKNTELDKLLHEIQSGVKLRPTKTNDRSRPILNGLRKFRRQMTIEEQIHKSESKGVLNESVNAIILNDDEEDELDDIDKVRDDLQSTKQMLALELRNKEAQERENKRLLAKIANLEAELQREKELSSGDTTQTTSVTSNGTDEVLIKNLKKDAEEAQKTSKMLEKKYQETAEHLDAAQKEIEEQKRLIANLEKKLQGAPDNEPRRQSEAVQQKESSPEMELQLSEEEEDETEEQKAERASRRLKREVDMMRAKLTRLKDKEINAKLERKALRDAMKNNQQLLKSEKRKFKKLQKEVEKMAAMMKAVEDECDDDETEEKEEEHEEEATEESEPESEESESEESDSDTESQSEAEDAEDNIKKENLDPRIKRHDGRLSSLKKGNYLLETNVERLKDEIKVHRDKCEALQTDLDSVIDLC